MNINLEQVPFSKAGSYLTFSVLRNSNISSPKRSKKELYLRTIHGSGLRELLRVELINQDKPVDYDIKVKPELLTLEADSGKIDICISESKIVKFKGKGAGVRFTFENPRDFDNFQPYGEHWQLIAYTHSLKIMFSSLTGEIEVDAPWEGVKSSHIIIDFVPDEKEIIEFVLEEFETSWEEKEYEKDFKTSKQNVKKEFKNWLDKTLNVGEEFKEERKLAAYVNWESLVNPEGILKRKAMYMSKNHMTNVWSWDHCFNAMALIENNPHIGWDQYVLMFDHQRDNGVLPDRVNDKEYYWNFVKPPIHGWVLKWMMNRSDFITETRLKEVYEPLSRWTDWWFKYRDTDGDGIPEYHHGNDSGWDNSTVFHKGAPVESPDLSAFLVIQMEVLSEIADILGKGEEAAEWEVRSEKLLANMLDHCWTGEEFIAPYPKTHEYFDKGDSLILYIPVILGKRLPESIKNKLIDDLKEEGRFLTENGLATESINSSFYESNGYWRGPIWAPSTMIMIEGIEAAGEKEFAMDLAYRFCQMIKKGGMAENFDAVTGEGLRDRAYTWTSSVFLMLANKVLLKKRD